jgi:hypothetical protein
MILPAITLWREFFRPFAEEKGNGFAKRQLFRRLKVRRNIWTIHPAEQQPSAARRGGAPKGEANGNYKTGEHTAELREARRLVRAILRRAKEAEAIV